MNLTASLEIHCLTVLCEFHAFNFSILWSLLFLFLNLFFYPIGMSFEYILWLPDLCFYWIIECVNECVSVYVCFLYFFMGSLSFVCFVIFQIILFCFFYHYSLGTDCFITWDRIVVNPDRRVSEEEMKLVAAGVNHTIKKLLLIKIKYNN